MTPMREQPKDSLPIHSLHAYMLTIFKSYSMKNMEKVHAKILTINY